MPSAIAIRQQVEAHLESRIPSALSPVQHIIRPRSPVGIASVDELLQGGLPVGAITELVGGETSGRTSLAMTFVYQMTRAAKVGAWIDVSNAFHPESAAAAGIDLTRLLWVRCGVSSTTGNTWTRLDQALRVTDLLLLAGGFSVIVLDLGSVPAEVASRVPLATWFRYRAAAEKNQTSVVLLTQHACAKSSAELLIRFSPMEVLHDESRVLSGVGYQVEIARERFAPAMTNVIALRKPPHRATNASWFGQATWAGVR